MKLNYKNTLQYKEDKVLFNVLLCITISYFMVFFLLFLGIFFFLKKESLEVATIVCFTGIFLFSILDLPFLIKTIKVRRSMNAILRCMDQIYVFKIAFKNPINHWFFQSKFSLSFEYEMKIKTLNTSWIYDSNNLANSLVEVGYIKDLEKIIIIKKINS